MNVLAIYAVNEHVADLMAEAAAERRAKEARAAKAKGSRFGFLTSRFSSRAGKVAVAAQTNALASS